MACIPLVLCLTVFGGFLLPHLTMEKSADGCMPESPSGHLCAGSGDTHTGGSFSGTVEVSGKGLSNVYTSAEDVQRIMDFIDEIKRNPEPTENENWEVFNSSDYSSTSFFATTDESCKTEGYKILIRQGDGSSTEYLLIGSTLIDQSNQKEFRMNEAASFALKNVLGIPLG